MGMRCTNRIIFFEISKHGFDEEWTSELFMGKKTHGEKGRTVYVMIKKFCKKQQGFTLVEIIIVLVILAILAAFTIPAMMGFVEDARGKANLVYAREIYEAMQAAVTQYNTSDTEPVANERYTMYYVAGQQRFNINPQTNTKVKSAIAEEARKILVSDVKFSKNGDGAYIDVNSLEGKVIYVEYTNNGYTAIIDVVNNTTTVRKGE